jgi:hypothetical protein
MKISARKRYIPPPALVPITLWYKWDAAGYGRWEYVTYEDGHVGFTDPRPAIAKNKGQWKVQHAWRTKALVPRIIK